MCLPIDPPAAAGGGDAAGGRGLCMHNDSRQSIIRFSCDATINLWANILLLPRDDEEVELSFRCNIFSVR